MYDMNVMNMGSDLNHKLGFKNIRWLQKGKWKARSWKRGSDICSDHDKREQPPSWLGLLGRYFLDDLALLPDRLTFDPP